MTLNSGRLVLNGGTPGDSKGRIWQAGMHRDYLDPQYATLEKGQLVIYRGTPGHQEATLFKTPPVSGPGPYKLGIAVSKKLAVFREGGGEERTAVWTSN